MQLSSYEECCSCNGSESPCQSVSSELQQMLMVLILSSQSFSHNIPSILAFKLAHVGHTRFFVALTCRC